MGAVNLVWCEPGLDEFEEELRVDCGGGKSCVVKDGKVLLVTSCDTIEITPEWHAKRSNSVFSIPDYFLDAPLVREIIGHFCSQIDALRQLQKVACTEERWDVVDYISFVLGSDVEGSL